MQPKDGNQTVRPSTMCEVVQNWAERTPDAPAFVAEGQRPLTYHALACLVERMRQTFNKWGYGRGDRIAIVHPDGGAEMATALVGIASEASAVPLNPDYTAGEFGIYLNDVGVSALVVPEGVETPARAAAEQLDIPVLELRLSDPETAGSVMLAGGGPAEPRQPGAATPDDEMLVLCTSGTTSRAKIVPARHRHMFARAAGVMRHFKLTPEDRCLNLMPLFHGHGLYDGLVMQLLAGSSVAFLPQFSAEAFFRQLETLQPTWYTAGYTFHHTVLTHAPSHAKAIVGARLRFIRSGSGRLEPSIARGLEDHFGVPVLETFATSETGAMAGNPAPPAQRKHGSVGVPFIGELVLKDADGNRVLQGERGEVAVRGPHVFDGYENDPEANAAAFTDGWFRTGDEGVIDPDGYLRLTGRVKEIINRGGEKITPLEVEETLLKHPDVVAATVFPVPHGTLGEEVAAAVVLEKGAVLTDELLARYVKKELTGFKVPRRIVFVDAIPKGPTGKIQRRLLAAALGLVEKGGSERATPEREDRPPTPLEARLQRVWAKTLGLDTVGLHDDFFLLGGDSLQAVDLFLAIEAQIGRRLPRAVLFEAGTVADMAARMEADALSGCVVAIQPEGDRPPFFCVHDQNGHVLNFRDLARHLGTTQPFYGIQSVGLDGDQAPFTRMEDMAAHYLREIRRIQPIGPYYIGGYSFGGRVAYAMAQQLRAVGESVALLALLDTYYLIGKRNVGARQWLARHRERIAKLDFREAPAYLGLRVRNAAASLKVSLRSSIVPALWRAYGRQNKAVPRLLRQPAMANDVIRRIDRPLPYAGEAVLFQAELPALMHPDIHDGWRKLIKGGLEIRPVPGRHYDFMKEPHVRTLAAELSDCLKERQKRHPAQAVRERYAVQQQ